MTTLHVHEAKSFKEKAVGLLHSQKPTALLIKTRWGIHTFGMKYPIDVIILDSSHKVIQLSESLKPNRIYLWNPIYSTALELPEKTIRKNDIKKTQTLKLSFI